MTDKLSIYDEHGLLYAWFEIVGDFKESEGKPQPKSKNFGFSRIPVKGELLQVGNYLWVVDQVIHHDMSPEVMEKFEEIRSSQTTAKENVFVATIQIKPKGYV